MRNVVCNLAIMTVVTVLCGCSCPSTRKPSVADLSTPEATVVSFTKAAARGDADAALACCLPGGLDYGDVKKALASAPDDDFRRLLESVDPEAPMPIVSQKTEGEKLAVVWRVTFKRDFRTQEGGGLTFKTGSTYDLDASLQKSGDDWLIDGI